MDPKHAELIARAQALVGEMSLSRSGMTACEVAAALRTAAGNIYTGVCLDLPCGIGFCAEHAAIAEMLKARETQIETIVAVAEDGVLSPCGRCRETMIQVDDRNAAAIVLLSGGRQITLRELLPEHWLTAAASPDSRSA